MIATSIEQSKNLIELGIDPSTADMVWVNTGYSLRLLTKDDEDAASATVTVPAWSVDALLNVIPKKEGNICLEGYFGKDSFCLGANMPYDISYSEEEGPIKYMAFGKSVLEAVSLLVANVLKNN